jgi:ATP-dependent Clp protease ATP-binding subunit ClpA
MRNWLCALWSSITSLLARNSTAEKQLLSDDASEAIRMSMKVAGCRNHSYLGSDHLLMGLILQKNNHLQELFREHSVNENDLVIELDRYLTFASSSGKPEPGKTTRFFDQTIFAAAKAAGIEHKKISSIHLFRGILEARQGVAQFVLKAQGLNLRKVLISLREQ